MHNRQHRQPEQLRPIRFQSDFTKFSTSSVLTHCGDTQVLCTVTIQNGVPRFLAGAGTGWLTAEYRMLPGATPQRHEREVLKLSGRTQEIQRLIGRSLRSTLDFGILGEKTILVDADVIQADAGTRTTSITGGYVALVQANRSRRTNCIADSASSRCGIGRIDSRSSVSGSGLSRRCRC